MVTHIHFMMIEPSERAPYLGPPGPTRFSPYLSFEKKPAKNATTDNDQRIDEKCIIVIDTCMDRYKDTQK